MSNILEDCFENIGVDMHLHGSVLCLFRTVASKRFHLNHLTRGLGSAEREETARHEALVRGYSEKRQCWIGADSKYYTCGLVKSVFAHRPDRSR